MLFNENARATAAGLRKLGVVTPKTCKIDGEKRRMPAFQYKLLGNRPHHVWKFLQRIVKFSPTSIALNEEKQNCSGCYMAQSIKLKLLEQLIMIWKMMRF